MVKQVSEFDVSKLYRTILEHIEIPNIIMHGSMIREFCDLQPKTGEDIFMYFNRLEEQIERVERLNYTCDPEMAITVPEWMVRWKMIEAAYRLPTFKFFFDNLRMKPPQEWSRMTKEELISGLRTTQNNLQVMEPGHGGVKANFVIAAQGARSFEPNDQTTRQAGTPRPNVQTPRPARTNRPRQPRSFHRTPSQRNQSFQASRNARGGPNYRSGSNSRSPARNPSPARGRPQNRGMCFQYLNNGICTKRGCTFLHQKRNFSSDRSQSSMYQSRSQSRDSSVGRGRSSSRGSGATVHFRQATPARNPVRATGGSSRPEHGPSAAGTGNWRHNGNRRGGRGPIARVVRATKVEATCKVQ
jgi:hypothetical protein